MPRKCFKIRVNVNIELEFVHGATSWSCDRPQEGAFSTASGSIEATTQPAPRVQRIPATVDHHVLSATDGEFESSSALGLHLLQPRTRH